jgi:hypothetical protein
MEKNFKYFYSLQSIIVHIGTAVTGHYISFA